MAYSTLAHPQDVWPIPVVGDAGSGSVEITTPGAFTPSDWYPLRDEPLTAACMLTGVTVRPTFVVFFPGGVPGVQLEIGASVDDVVTPIANYPFHNANSFNANSYDNGLYLPNGPAIDLLPAGCIPMARLSTGETADGAMTYRVQASYLQKPVTGSVWTTTAPQIAIPHLATMIVIPSGAGSYVDGSPVTIRAASGPALLITGMYLWTNDATPEALELDLYVNGVYKWTERGGYGGKQGMPYWCQFRKGLDVFPEDCLIEGVSRDDVGSRNVYVYLFGHEQ